MSLDSIELPNTDGVRKGLIAALGLLVILAAFGSVISQLVDRWATQEEYSHGFLIPVVSAWLLWARRDALKANVGHASWSGSVLLAFAMLLHLAGLLSAVSLFSQIAFVVAISGWVLSLGGYSLLKVAAFPILFLLFAIPMPRFIDYALSIRLQLLSSELGAFFIRLFGIPVYLDGNVIDLGYYKVQVVEACSGLRYIYPLLSLSFLAAYLFKAPFWQRAVVFLSAVPITIVMNSLRIGVVGITVNYWGTEAAEGLLHLFEGWFIFLACACILMCEIYALSRMSGRPFLEVFSLPVMASDIKGTQQSKGKYQAPIFASLLVLGIAEFAVFQISGRTEIIPDRPRFVAFPEQIGSWRGRAFLLEPDVERLIKPDDYLLSDYQGSDGEIVNLYVAYYSSQRKNDTPHSPGECIPANGWTIRKFERTIYRDRGAEWPINRVVIEKNAVKQLVYYWFDERGRKIANEYLAKWYFHADAVLMNRTDGALVRLVTQIRKGENEDDADRRLQAFVRVAMPAMSDYLPSSSSVRAKSAGFESKNPKL